MSLEFKNLMDETYEFQLKTLDWRNSDNVNKFFQINKISNAQHKKWLLALKNKPKKQIAFVIYYKQKPIGLTYFRNINAESCDWGIYIHAVSQRGKGIGQKTLFWAINYAKNILNISNINLEVKNDNIAAIRCYEKLGFVYENKKDEHFFKYKKIL